jgi:sucrose-6F-phosphate phosphohydrolase
MNVVKHMVVSDLDGTLLGDDEALCRFSDWWSNCRDECALVYASGRLFESVIQVVESTKLPQPNVVISAVGTQILLFPSGKPLLPWPRLMSPWDRQIVCQTLGSFPRLQMQPDEFQFEHKVSYYLIDATVDELAQIEASLFTCGLGFELVYSSREHLDVLPRGTNKGFAVLALARHWNIDSKNVIVSTISSNSLDLIFI